MFPEAADPTTEFWQQYQRCIGERVPVHFQDHFAPLEMWAGVTAYPTSTGGIAIFFRDITTARIAQQEQERLADIVESSDDAIISPSRTCSRSWAMTSRSPATARQGSILRAG